MKNIKNIIEQKYPPENPNDLWMKDNVLYKSTHKGWTPLTVGGNSSTNGVTFTTWLELKDKRDAGKLIPGSLYRITDYNCTTTQENTRSAGHQFDIVLLALSEDKLAEEGWAMEHPTDVYDVTFSDGVTKKCYLYIISIVIDDSRTFEEWNIIDVETHLGTNLNDIERNTGTVEINEETKTIVFADFFDVNYDSLVEPDLPYNYFQNSNLSAWKVWYCLDNDTSKFAWADDSVDEGTPASIDVIDKYDFIRTAIRNKELDNFEQEYKYAWDSGVGADDFDGIFYTNVENPEISDTVYYTDIRESLGVCTITSLTPAHEGTELPNGRSVIYRLIDEWNNDVPYDFKNIQYVRPLTDGEYDPEGEDTWVYTLNNIDEQPYDASLNTTIFDNSANNKIDSLYTFINDKNYFTLPDVVILYGGGYNNISSSQIITILQNVVKMDGCQDCIIGNADSQFYICDALTTTESDDPAIYIANKKVLTES